MTMPVRARAARHSGCGERGSGDIDKGCRWLKIRISSNKLVLHLLLLPPDMRETTLTRHLRLVHHHRPLPLGPLRLHHVGCNNISNNKPLTIIIPDRVPPPPLKEVMQQQPNKLIVSIQQTLLRRHRHHQRIQHQLIIAIIINNPPTLHRHHSHPRQ